MIELSDWTSTADSAIRACADDMGDMVHPSNAEILAALADVTAELAAAVPTDDALPAGLAANVARLAVLANNHDVAARLKARAETAETTCLPNPSGGFSPMDAQIFDARVDQATGGRVEDMTAAEVVDGLTVADHALNLLLNRAEDLGLVSDEGGLLIVPIGLTYPEGIDMIETVLTRPRPD